MTTVDEAVAAMAEAVAGHDGPLRVGVGDADAADGADALLAALEALPQVAETIRYTVGPSVAAHTGAGTIGAVFHRLDPDARRGGASDAGCARASGGSGIRGLPRVRPGSPDRWRTRRCGGWVARVARDDGGATRQARLGGHASSIQVHVHTPTWFALRTRFSAESEKKVVDPAPTAHPVVQLLGPELPAAGSAARSHEFW